MNSYASIDGQNLYSGVKELGWTLDPKTFRDYLRDKYRVTTAYYFVGYMRQYTALYAQLGAAGYTLRFRPVVAGRGHAPKGNIDADFVLQAILGHPHYNEAVLVSGDGAFYSLAQHLVDQGQLAAVLAPNRTYCSALLKRAGRGKATPAAEAAGVARSSFAVRRRATGPSAWRCPSGHRPRRPSRPRRPTSGRRATGPARGADRSRSPGRRRR